MIKKITALVTLLCASFLFSICERISAADDLGLTPLTRISSPKADSAEPSLAAAPDGGIYVAWVEHLESGATDLFVQKFDKTKSPLGEKVRVNLQTGQATAWRGDPPTLTVGSDGTVYVGWTERVETDEGKANNLYLSVSRDSGRTFDAPAKVNDNKTPAVVGMHSLAVDKNNNVYIAWLDERYLKHEAHEDQEKTDTKTTTKEKQSHKHMESNREVYFATSRDGGKTFTANKRLADDACPCCKTSIVTAPDGKVYISWRQVLPGNFRHIAIATSSDGGNIFTPTTIVSDDQWQLEACPVSGATLAVGMDNTLKVAWYSAGDAGKPGLYWSGSNDGGKTFLPRALIYEGILTTTPILLGGVDKDYKIVWQSNGKIWQLSTKLNSDESYKIEEIGTGKLPSAVVANEKLFIGFIKTEDDKRSIWLY